MTNLLDRASRLAHVWALSFERGDFILKLFDSIDFFLDVIAFSFPCRDFDRLSGPE